MSFSTNFYNQLLGYSNLLFSLVFLYSLFKLKTKPICEKVISSVPIICFFIFTSLTSLNYFISFSWISLLCFCFSLLTLGVLLYHIPLIVLSLQSLEYEINEKQLMLSNLTQVKKELELKTKELEESNKQLQQLVYVSSHDLQEPLRIISNYVELLIRKIPIEALDSGSISIYSDFILKSTKRMKNLLNDILRYFKIANHSDILEQVNIRELLEETLDQLGAKETVDINGVSNIDMICIKYQMQQLFQNLIGNALKFRSEREVKISIKCLSTEEYYIFSVQDNGIGISQRFKEVIFEVFQRLNSQEQYEGTGIGLSICKKVVQNHLGNIWIESELEVGSIFFFTISKSL